MPHRVLPLLLLCVAWCPAQDVFVGGRVDVELTSDREVRLDFGRDAGIDVTFTQPGVIDAYADVSVAGGRVRVQELYAQLPQTRRVVDVTLGRFLLPYGDPGTQVVDRYAPGGRELFDTYRGFRRGNVLLDTDVLGLRLSRALGPVTVDLVAAQAPPGDLCGAGRLVAEWAGMRAGVSGFVGRELAGGSLTHGALHLGYRGHGVDALWQGFLGRSGGGDFRGWATRVAGRVPGTGLTLFGAQTLFNDDTMNAVSATRLGAEYRFDRTWRAELRYEFHQAPPPDHDNRLVARALAVF